MTQRSTQWHVNGNVEILLQKKAWRFFQTQREIRKIDPDLIKIDLGIPSEEFLRITILLRIFLFYAVRTSLVEGTGYLYVNQQLLRQAHSILRDEKDGNDPGHQGKELLPLVLLIFPFFGNDLRSPDVNEGSGHNSQHYGIHNRCCKFIHRHTDSNSDGSHQTEHR